MKNLGLLFIILSLSFCKSINLKKTIEQQTNNKDENYFIQEKIEIIPNQTIHVMKDETGAKYLKLTPGDKTVFKYSYNKKPHNQNLMDGGYTQNIVFEVSKKIKDLVLKDSELKSIKLISELFAFRNNELFMIDKGSLYIKVIDKHHIELEINLDDSYKIIQKKHIRQIINIE